MPNLKPRKKIDTLEFSNTYYQFQKWYESGDLDKIPDELEVYKFYIDTAHDIYKVFKNQLKGVKYCVNLLYKRFANTDKAISYRVAHKYMIESVNIYYENEKINNEVYGNLKLRQLDRELAILDEIKTDVVKSSMVKVKIIELQLKIIGFFKEKMPELPEFAKPIKIYTSDITAIGGQKIDRNELYQQTLKFLNKVEKTERQRIEKEMQILDVSYEEIKTTE